MRKFLLISLILIFAPAISYGANKKMIPAAGDGEKFLPNIFIYSIPDDNSQKSSNNEENIEYVSEDNSEEEIVLQMEEESQTLGATTLKGYAQFVEDASVVHLKDFDNNYVVNLKTPQKIPSSKGLELKSAYKTPVQQYVNVEYAIAPSSIKATEKNGDFSFGASYSNEIDNIAMLEKETGLFTKYEKDRFALSSSFKKSLNTTYAQDYNTISIAPELKFNNYFALKNVLSADITRNRRSSSLVLSVNPFGKQDKERLLLELGAKETIYMDTGFNKTQFSFSTLFKL